MLSNLQITVHTERVVNNGLPGAAKK